jgi:flavin-dependent dehydrogenase
MRPRERFDVAILGGGLAGQCLALQIKRARPTTPVLLLEKRSGPARPAAFKVGESSDNFAAYYFAQIIGMRDHLASAQLRKGGLRFYFPGGDNSELGRRPEFGPWRPSPSETYQIDRGVFENELAARNRNHEVDLIEGARVTEVEFGKDRHQVTFETDGETRTVSARWVVDATGRSHFLQRKLDLGVESPHKINAAWLRLDGGFDHEEWCSEPQWRDRIIERGWRQRDTTHLVGRGYWVWLIQLASGPISIGVCADPRFHPFEELNNLDSWIEWAKQHEPQLGAMVDARRDQVLDFLKVENFAFGTKRLYSTDRWCLVGDAAMFSDALYSPGSDFIGLGNSFVTDLVIRDARGEDVQERVEYFNQFLLDLFQRFLSYYLDNYVLFGNPQIAGIKVAVDTMVYWGEVALPFTKGEISDLGLLQAIEPTMRQTDELLARVQQFYREWDALERLELPPIHRPGRTPSTAGERLIDLISPIDQAELPSIVAENHRRFQAVALLMFHKMASRLLPDFPIDEDTPLNPFAIGLDPERWEADGLFGTPERPGMTVAEAKQVFHGFDQIWYEAQPEMVAEAVS